MQHSESLMREFAATDPYNAQVTQWVDEEEADEAAEVQRLYAPSRYGGAPVYSPSMYAETPAPAARRAMSPLPHGFERVGSPAYDPPPAGAHFVGDPSVYAAPYDPQAFVGDAGVYDEKRPYAESGLPVYRIDHSPAMNRPRRARGQSNASSQSGDDLDEKDDGEDGMRHFGPAPDHPVRRRNRARKRVALTNGNVVIDLPVPTRLRKILPLKDESEFTFTRVRHLESIRLLTFPVFGLHLRSG